MQTRFVALAAGLLAVIPPSVAGQVRPAGRAPIGAKRQIVALHDRDGDGRLDNEERRSARGALRKEREARSRRRWPWPLGRGREESRRTPRAGPRVAPADVKSWPDAALYDPSVLRVIFLEFENEDWERELADFHGTDVDVPAVLTVDGRRYEDVGVRFRGATSFYRVGDGWKRSFNLSLDHARSDQRLYGYKTVELLNSYGDPSFARSFLYYHIARHYLPAPRANFVKVVINGESWGIYINQQQFNKDFLEEWFGTRKGTRWKVVGDPRNRSFSYLGDSPEPYQRQFELKTGKAEDPWTDLVKLCETMNRTPAERLPEALFPILDVDGALWFLALDNVLMNGDGYFFTPTSDFNLYRDRNGRFHLIPRDANETFKGGRGGFGPSRSPRVHGVELAPLAGADNSNMTLIDRLLAPPELRARYLAHVRTITEEWLDWSKLKPIIAKLETLITDEVRDDTRKLESFTAFRSELREGDKEPRQRDGRPVPRRWGLKTFVEERRRYLLARPELAKPDARAVSLSLEEIRGPVRVTAELTEKSHPRQVWLYYATEGDAHFARREMLKTKTGDGRRYAATVSAPQTGHVLRYYVEVRSGEAAAFFPSGAEAGALKHPVEKRWREFTGRN